MDGSAQWAVTSAVTIAAGASASVCVQATVAGTSGNLAANTAGTLVSPVAGISSVVSDQNGIAGGAPIEAVESWRARIIDAIRTPYGGGTSADYEKWATAAGAAYVNVVLGWLGRGTVGVIVAMSGGVAGLAQSLNGASLAVLDANGSLILGGKPRLGVSGEGNLTLPTPLPDSTANYTPVSGTNEIYSQAGSLGVAQ
ncbi:baseplate J/gp47 family protein [Gluconobacter morbifer]|uniref:Mu-like prophage FluMu protein n=1 Tax=Gluconobacter morbifer G707 TaxID=1088869 RepID=G6XH75_9PROT|nr:baseplate J/gp47 family protein [Gluconobacter morbifer]EHH69533.1 Mu-like prophage FluMu protein [Gluconobacter morbifer G707]